MITKNELDKFDLSPLDEMNRVGCVKDYIIRVTSGTSGNKPLFLIRTRRNNVATKPLFFYCGATRVVAFWGTLNARFSRATQFLFYPKDNNYTILNIDNRDLHRGLNKIFYDFKPEGLCGFPSYIARGLQFITSKEILRGIRFMSVSGEGINKAQEVFFRNKLPNAIIKNSYASAEAGCMSGPHCKYIPSNHYHPYEAVKIDIVNKDEAGIGEIVVSYHLTPSIYIERYQTGDAGRMIEKPCPCGHPTTFELLGRKDFDFIKLLGATLRQEEFERVMEGLKEYIIDFRGEAKEVVGTNTLIGKITLQIIGTKKLKQKQNPEQFLQHEISKRLFVTPSKTLAEIVEEGIFTPLTISLARTFPYQHKSTKLKKI